MPNTYTQLYVQIVFAVRGRQSLIPKQHREELHKYITGIVQNRDYKLLAVFCMPDHIHLLTGLNPSMAISDLVKSIKIGTGNFINDSHWLSTKFNWQQGFGAFSYSRGEIDSVIKYILNQEIHHQKIKFREEYVELLEEFEIDYDAKYLFEWAD